MCAMQEDELSQRLLEYARHGMLEEFLETTKEYFTLIGENPESPTNESIRKLYTTARTKEGTTVLHYASANNHKDILDLFVRSLTREDLNYKNDDGSTALHWAAFNGSLDCVIALSDAGADLTLKNSQGRSAMTLAELQGHSNVSEQILERIEIKKDDMKTEICDDDEILLD